MKRLFLSLCMVLMTTSLWAEQRCQPNMIRSTSPETFQDNDGCAVDWYPAASIPDGVGPGYGITYGGGQFVTTLRDGGFLISSEGSDWSQYGDSRYKTRDVTWGRDLYIAVGYGTYYYAIQTSLDGKTWTKFDPPFPTLWDLEGVAWNGELFVAVGLGGRVVTSPDGLNWTDHSPPGEPRDLLSVTWRGDQFVAVGIGDPPGIPSIIITSPDGLTWTERDAPTDRYIIDVAWGGNGFVAVGGRWVSTILTSPDGVTWTQCDYDGDETLYSVAWGGNQYVVVGEDGLILTSSDGLTWTERDSGTTTSLHGVTYGADRFVVVGGGISDATIIYSPYDNGQPNLAPYRPSEWDDNIVISNQTGTRTEDTIYAGEPAYIDFAFVNDGTADITTQFNSQLYINGTLVRNGSSSGLTQNYYRSVNDFEYTFPSAGTYTLRLVVDANNDVDESNENDNEYQRDKSIGTVGRPNLTPHQLSGWDDKIVVSNQTGTRTEDTIYAGEPVYIDYAYINNGTADITTEFDSQLYINGTLVRTGSLSGLAENSAGTVSDFEYSFPSAGTYTLRLVVDANNDVDESNENDNEYQRTKTVNAVGGLSVSPSDGLVSSGYAGGPFSPSSIIYTLTNIGSQSINYQIEKTETWISLSQTSGTLSVGGTTTVTVLINGNADALPEGDYSDSISFTNITNGIGNTTRPVSLKVMAEIYEGDFDNDGDVDGADLQEFIFDSGGLGLDVFAANFGKLNCP